MTLPAPPVDSHAALYARSDRDVRVCSERRGIGSQEQAGVFGVGVLAFVAGNAGGVTRDLLIGAVPPAAIKDWRYVAVSLAAGGVTFVWYRNVKRLQPVVLLFDAAGLGLFAVAGTQKALALASTRSCRRCWGC